MFIGLRLQNFGLVGFRYAIVALGDSVGVELEVTVPGLAIPDTTLTWLVRQKHVT